MGQNTTIDRPPNSVRGETWNEVWRRKMAQHPPGATTKPARGGATKPAQPEGTTPLERDERDERPINESAPGTLRRGPAPGR